MPAKHMCVSRGQGPVISPYPWIPEKADLMASPGQNWELIAAASRLGLLRALFLASSGCPGKKRLHGIRREGLEQARWG